LIYREFIEFISNEYLQRMQNFNGSIPTKACLSRQIFDLSIQTLFGELKLALRVAKNNETVEKTTGNTYIYSNKRFSFNPVFIFMTHESR